MSTEFATHSDPLDKQVQSPGGTGTRGWLVWMWRRLVSMRTALILLLLLALAAIPGSLLPQRTSDRLAVNEYFTEEPGRAEFFDRLGLFDVYGSPWFSAIYLLLFISLIGCVAPRVRQHWQQWRAGPPPPPKRLSRTMASTNTSPINLDRAEAELRKNRWRVNRGENYLAAEKGYLRETGNQIFHLSLIGVLVAIGLGATLGWHGNVVVREGNGFANEPAQFDEFIPGRFSDIRQSAPFTFQLNSFAVSFNRDEAQRGTPTGFAADVTTTNLDTGERDEHILGVNDPVEIDGVKVFLLGHGYAPHVIVRDAEGVKVFDDTVVFIGQDPEYTSSGVIKVPDADPQLGFRGLFLPTAAISEERGPFSTFAEPDNPALFLSAFNGDLGLNEGEPQNVYELDDSALEQVGLRSMPVGDTWEFPGGSIEFVGFDRWISVKVAHDPGGFWAMILIGIAVLGVTASLFVRRRRVWLVNAPDTAYVAGVSRGGDDRISEDVRDVTAKITGGNPDSVQVKLGQEGVNK